MVSSLVLVLAVVSPVFTFPFTTQDVNPVVQNYQQIPVNEQYTGGSPVQQVYTHGEKTGAQDLQTQGVDTVRPVQVQEQKTGAQVSSENVQSVPINVERTGNQGYPQGYTGEKCSGVETARPVSSHLEKTGVQGTTGSQVNEQYTGGVSGTPVTHLRSTGVETFSEINNEKYKEQQQAVRVPGEQVYPEQYQQNYPKDQHIVPVPVGSNVQPLSALPVSQGYPTGQFVNPIIVSSEGVPERVVPVNPVKQGQYQAEQTNYNQDKQFLHQQQQQTPNTDYTPLQTQETLTNQQQFYNPQSEVSGNINNYPEKQGQTPYVTQETQQVHVLHTPEQVQKTKTEQSQYEQQDSSVIKATQNVPTVTGKQLPVQAYYPNQNQGVEPNHQLYSTQPEVPNKYEQQVTYQQTAQSANPNYTPEQYPRAQEVVPHQQEFQNISPQVANYPNSVEKESASYQSVQSPYYPLQSQTVPHIEVPLVRPLSSVASTQQQVSAQ